MSAIEDTIVLQLAKFNDVEKSVSNAIWSNHTKQLTTVNQGDQIVISKSYIDTRNLTSSGIVILEDIPLELEMWFYWTNDGNPGSLSTGLDATSINSNDQSGAWWNPASAGNESWNNIYSPPHYTLQMTLQSVSNIEFTTATVVANNTTQTSLNSSQTKAYADGRPYLLVYTDGTPYTQTWKYTLKAATYSPDALASLLTKAMAEVRKDTAESLNKPNAVDWFDPYAPKVNLPNDTTLDQPFVVNTNGSPPIWALSKFITDGSNTTQFSMINAQPYLQITPNNGLPTNWFQGCVGSISNPANPIGHPAPPGPPPKPSLCFKNIISDCPVPNPTTNLPPLPLSDAIPANEMVVGAYYQIITLGDTLWDLSGDTNPTPAVGDSFICIQPGTLPTNSTIPYTQMITNNFYSPVNLGLSYLPSIQYYEYDTNWDSFGFTETPVIGTRYENTGVVANPIPLIAAQSGENSSNLGYIIQGITFNIISTDPQIDWSVVGGPVNTLINGVIPCTQMQVGHIYKIVNQGTPYNFISISGNTTDTNWDVIANGIFGNTNYIECFVNPNDPSVLYPVNGILSTLGTPYTAFLLVGNTIRITEQSVPSYDFTIFGYTTPNILTSQMVIGNTYEIVTLGATWNPPPATNPEYTYDTNWVNLGNNIHNPAQVGDQFVNTASYVNTISDDLTQIVTGVNFTITATATIYDWTTVGGPANSFAYKDQTVDTLQLTDSYIVYKTGVNVLGNDGFQDTNWNSLLGQTYVVGYVLPVGTRFIANNAYVPIPILEIGQLVRAVNNTNGKSIITLTVDTNPPTDWRTWGYTGSYPAVMPITFTTTTIGNINEDALLCTGYFHPTGSVKRLSSYQLPFTFTATANGVEPDPTLGTMTYQGQVNSTGTVKLIAGSPTVPFTLTVTEIPTNTPPVFNGVGIVVPTGTVQEVGLLTTPFTFTATATGPSYYGDTTGRFTGNVLGTGTVNLGNLVQGTCLETLNPTSPNYYLYPLKLTSNPTFSTETDGGGRGGGVFNYTFPLVGSTEISLAYNDLANIFQWEYTHSPIQQATAPTSAGDPVSFTEVVGIVNSFIPDANVTTEQPPAKGFISSTCKLVTKSGCMFRRMEPASFWQGILGFSSDLIVKDEELGIGKDNNGTYILKPIALPADINRFTFQRFNSVTTRGLLTSAMNFNSNSIFPNIEESYINGMFYDNPASAPVQLAYSSVLDVWYSEEIAYNFIVDVLNSNATVYQNFSSIPYNSPYNNPPPWNESWYQALATTVTIDAITPPKLLADSYGHYLIEIQGYDGGGLLNENQKYNVKSIVSNYYANIGSFTTGPFTDPQVYTHVGEPMTINSFKVRILDPKTMQEVGGLGTNSCIYIQVNKALTALEQVQV